MSAHLHDALNRLLADPQDFLETHYLGTSGSAQAGVSTFWLQEIVRPDPGKSRIRFEDRLKFQIGPAPTLRGPAIALPVISVPMLHDNQVNIGALAGVPLVGGVPRLAITGQLSGCTYFAANTNVGTLATHIKPTADGVMLHRRMARMARFANGGVNFPYVNTGMFGRAQYEEHATVIGVFRVGAWEFWAQRNNSAEKEAGRVTRFM